jgi:DNA polymerase III alpha subunit
VAPPEEIIAAAVEQKMPAVTLTDTNGLYAAVPFYQAAKAAGVKPIVGVVLDVEFRILHFASRNSKNENRHSPSMAMVLLAADMEGYSNLCQLVTLRHLGTTELAKSKSSGKDDGQPAEDEERPVTLEELAKHSRGVIALCPLPAQMHRADTSHESPVTSHQSRFPSPASRHWHIHRHAGITRHRRHSCQICVHPHLPFAIELQRSRA